MTCYWLSQVRSKRCQWVWFTRGGFNFALGSARSFNTECGPGHWPNATHRHKRTFGLKIFVIKLLRRVFRLRRRGTIGIAMCSYRGRSTWINAPRTGHSFDSPTFHRGFISVGIVRASDGSVIGWSIRRLAPKNCSLSSLLTEMSALRVDQTPRIGPRVRLDFPDFGKSRWPQNDNSVSSWTNIFCIYKSWYLELIPRDRGRVICSKTRWNRCRNWWKNMASSSDFVHNRHNQSILVRYLDLIIILLFCSMNTRENYCLCTRISVTIFNDRRDSSVDSTTNRERTQHYLMNWDTTWMAHKRWALA